MSGLFILASRSVTTYALINRLAERFPIEAVIFEEKDFRRILHHRWRKLGTWTLGGQLLFLLYDRMVIRRQSRRRITSLLAGVDTRAPDKRLCLVLDVPSVNDPQVHALFSERRPAVVVVSGTRIISRRTLELAPTFINIHAGITPRYRGAHGAFWAVYEGRPELSGTTVHVIDSGVDTGPIIGQVRIEVDPLQDTYRTLPVRQYLAAFDLMDSAVRSALAGQVKTYLRDDLESAQWYSPTLPQYVQFLSQMRKLLNRKNAHRESSVSG